MTKSDLLEFIEYCQMFYDVDYLNRDGEDEYSRRALYPFATESEIVDAVLQHIALHPYPFEGDSVDREFVRDRIIQTQSMKKNVLSNHNS